LTTAPSRLEREVWPSLPASASCRAPGRRGRHPAALNFGGCLSYATARVADRPLVRKGDDFRQSDLPLA